jgi:2-dehydro-3-deoxyphosphogalactonate aldolase
LVAILRGLDSERAAEVGGALFDAGFRAIEVPLNRPQAMACIETLVRIAPPDALIGAGTVMDAKQVEAIAVAGGRLVVSPHLDTAIVSHARARNLYVVPGVFTPTEAFAALRAGAHALKLFPAEILTPAGLRALRSVLPDDALLWPVGGITPDTLAPWRHAGADGFGIGAALFKPGVTLDGLATQAHAFIAAWELTGA